MKQHQTGRTARSGAWSNPATWENQQLPRDDDWVLIRPGHVVQYDIESDEVIRFLKIVGELRFATDRNTRLNVGLVRIEQGEEMSEEGFECESAEAPRQGHQHHHGELSRPAMVVGTPSQPIEAGHTAVIRLVYCEGMNKESCPAIVCCGGRMDFHGAPMNRTWVKLAETADYETTEITLAEPVTGWRPGDRIMVPSTERLFLFGEQDKLIPTVRDDTHSEERTIAAVDGTTIILEQPLDWQHLAEGEFRGEVANLSRNVVVESADPDGIRGHTMYHAGSAGSISYAEFRYLGKRDVLGRYSLHYHLCRDTMRGSYVIGASIHDSDNRWLTIHGTDYLLVRDCVGYNSIGHGFFLEDGTEVFNVLDRNLAVQARHGNPLPKQMLPYDENEGAGFWWANSLNTFTRNVTAECDQYGYRFEATKTADFDPILEVPQPDGRLKKVDIRTLPFVRFDDNEAHTQRRFALNLGGIRHISNEEDYRARHTDGGDMSRILGGHVDGVGPDTRHPFIIRNFRVWQSQWVFHGGSPCVLLDGVHADRCTYGIFKTRTDAHEYRNLNMTRINTAQIFQPWGSSSFEENYLRYLEVDHDDLPPTTVITHCESIDGQQLRVRGVAADNGHIRFVTVNGHEAKSLTQGFAEWEVVLPLPPSAGSFTLTAQAEDAKGNVEPRPHQIEYLPAYAAHQHAASK